MRKETFELTQEQAWEIVGVIQDAYDNSQCYGQVNFFLKQIFEKFPEIKEEFGDMLDE